MSFQSSADYVSSLIFLKPLVLMQSPCSWTFSKVVPKGSRIQETLQFLLDHPRRSFLYLFPA